MKVWVAVGLLVGFSGLAVADEPAIPAAEITDPVPDPIHPPHSAQVLIPSHGVGMNALFYLPGGLERSHLALSWVMGRSWGFLDRSRPRGGSPDCAGRARRRLVGQAAE